MKSTLPSDRFHPRGVPRSTAFRGPFLSSSWRIRRSRRTTLLLGLAIVFGLYYLLRDAVEDSMVGDLAPPSMGGFEPDYDIDQYRQRLKSKTPPKVHRLSKATKEPDPTQQTKSSREGDEPPKPVEQTYDGPVRFGQIYETLRRLGSAGTRARNRFVLFFAENSHAASRLLAIACEMSAHEKVSVHFGLTGRNDIEIEELIRLNRLDAIPSCKLTIHDARVNRPAESTHRRNKLVIITALKYFNTFMHPQAVIVDPSNEDGEFIEAVREKNKELGHTTIELPHRDLIWFPFVDSGGLKAWNDARIDILVRADEHTGNLIRLLKSLKSADYFGKLPSRITVQIPASHTLDSMTKRYLSEYNWPSREGFTLQALLMEEDNAAARVVESFYPIDPNTYLLILDPNVELSRTYFHYLFYSLLQYRYNFNQGYSYAKLSSISLLHLNSSVADSSDVSPFLSPIPSANATLIFPDHWSLFHDYMRELLHTDIKVDRTLPYDHPTNPKWLEPFTHLSAARGWQTLYPTFPEPIAVLHDEHPSSPRRNSEPLFVIDLATNMESTLKLLKSGLPDWNEIEWIGWDGQETDSYKSSLDAAKYRRRISACDTGDGTGLESIEDLFCPFSEGSGSQPTQSRSPGKDSDPPVVTPLPGEPDLQAKILEPVTKKKPKFKKPPPPPLRTYAHQPAHEAKSPNTRKQARVGHDGNMRMNKRPPANKGQGSTRKEPKVGGIPVEASEAEEMPEEIVPEMVGDL